MGVFERPGTLPLRIYATSIAIAFAQGAWAGGFCGRSRLPMAPDEHAGQSAPSRPRRRPVSSGTLCRPPVQMEEVLPDGVWVPQSAGPWQTRSL